MDAEGLEQEAEELAVGKKQLRGYLQERRRERGGSAKQHLVNSDDVWVGGHATTLPGVTIGSGAFVAAGAHHERTRPLAGFAARQEVASFTGWTDFWQSAGPRMKTAALPAAYPKERIYARMVLDRVERTIVNRVVFLDIDGVLQPTLSKKRFEHSKDFDALKHLLAGLYGDQGYLSIDGYDMGAVYYDWDLEATQNLRRVLASNDASIVLSSDWRFGHSHDEMTRFFQLFGLEDFYAEDLPSTRRYSNKTDDIRRYLDAHPELTNYAVVDDADMYGAFGDYHVNTRYQNRLDLTSAERIDYLLRHGPWWREERATDAVVRDGLRRVVIVDAQTSEEVRYAMRPRVHYEARAGVVLAGGAANERRPSCGSWVDFYEDCLVRVEGVIPGVWEKDDADFLPGQVYAWLLRRPSLEHVLIASHRKPDEWGDALKHYVIPFDDYLSSRVCEAMCRR